LSGIPNAIKHNVGKLNLFPSAGEGREKMDKIQKPSNSELYMIIRTLSILLLLMLLLCIIEALIQKV
jgi:hypothetical protein